MVSFPEVIILKPLGRKSEQQIYQQLQEQGLYGTTLVGQTWTTKCRASCSLLCEGNWLVKEEPSGRRNCILAMALKKHPHTHELIFNTFCRSSSRLYGQKPLWVYLSCDSSYTWALSRSHVASGYSGLATILYLLHVLVEVFINSYLIQQRRDFLNSIKMPKPFGKYIFTADLCVPWAENILLYLITWMIVLFHLIVPLS